MFSKGPKGMFSSKGGSGLASRMANRSASNRAESTAQAVANAKWKAEIKVKAKGKNDDSFGYVESCSTADIDCW